MSNVDAIAIVDRTIKQRAARDRAVRIVKAEWPQPWVCGHCGGPIEKLGRGKRDGMVHHKNEDPWDNRRKNHELLHSTCHHSHHHKGKPKPPSVGAGVRARWKGVTKTAKHRAKLAASQRVRVACPDCGYTSSKTVVTRHRNKMHGGGSNPNVPSVR